MASVYVAWSKHREENGRRSGSGIGAGSEVITKGDQVKVPSETLLDLTLQQELSIPTRRGS
jgi:hypothetical protein